MLSRDSDRPVSEDSKEVRVSSWGEIVGYRGSLSKPFRLVFSRRRAAAMLSITIVPSIAAILSSDSGPLDRSSCSGRSNGGDRVLRAEQRRCDPQRLKAAGRVCILPLDPEIKLAIDRFRQPRGSWQLLLGVTGLLQLGLCGG